MLHEESLRSDLPLPDQFLVPTTLSATVTGSLPSYYQLRAPRVCFASPPDYGPGIPAGLTVEAATGTAVLRVPLPLSAGRNGQTPDLSLCYRSGNGDGVFGMGWSLELPAIRRMASEGVSAAQFTLDGVGRLLPSPEAPRSYTVPGGAVYTVRSWQPEQESGFARIEEIWEREAQHAWWRITSAEGVATYYGLTEQGTASGADRHINCWLPQLVIDGLGNVQHYNYMRMSDNGGTKVCLKQAAYCNLRPYFTGGDCWKPALPEDRIYLMEVVFDYGDHDPFQPAYEPAVAAGALPEASLCRRVLVFHRFRELNEDESQEPVLVRSMNFVHDVHRCITGITVHGYKCTGGTSAIEQTLPPMRLTFEATGGYGPDRRYLLVGYSDGVSCHVQLTYKSLADYYSEDVQDGRPWKQLAPASVFCVEYVGRTGKDNTIHEEYYQYHDDCYTQLVQGLYSFGRVDVRYSSDDGTNSRTFCVHTWYYTGEDPVALTEGSWAGSVHFYGRAADEPAHKHWRVLKGLPCREEIYELSRDGAAPQLISVKEYAYGIRACAAPGAMYVFRERTNRHVVATDGGLIHQELVLSADEQGHVLESATLNYNAGRLSDTVIRYTRNQYTGALSAPEHYSAGKLAVREVYEIHADMEQHPAALQDVAALKGLITSAAERDELRLLQKQRTIYLSDDTHTPLPPGQHDTLGLISGQYTLAYTPDLCALYGERLEKGMLADAGYTDLDGDGCYWVPSGKVQYNDTCCSEFYLPAGYLDPWGKYTEVFYWENMYAENYYLQPKAFNDAAEQIVVALAYDWRSLQLTCLEDAQGVCTEQLHSHLDFAWSGAGAQPRNKTEELTSAGNDTTDDDRNTVAPKDGQYFNLLGTAICHTDESGASCWLLPDAAGNPLYYWSATGECIRYQYDELRRLAVVPAV